MTNTENIKSTQQRMPGIPCPNCNNFIPTSIQQILHSNIICCPSCGLVINIDKQKSDKAIEILKKINNENTDNNI